MLGVDPGRRERAVPRADRHRAAGGRAWTRASTVREAVELYGAAYPRPRPADEVLELVGLADRADARASTLSGGQRRRLDLALGIVGDPELLFLDEPTTGFDPAARRAPWELIAGPARARQDDPAHHALHGRGGALADRVVVLAPRARRSPRARRVARRATGRRVASRCRRAVVQLPAVAAPSEDRALPHRDADRRPRSAPRPPPPSAARSSRA